MCVDVRSCRMLHQPCTLLRSPSYLPLKVQGASPYTMVTMCLQLISQSPDAGSYAQFGCRVMSVRAEQGETAAAKDFVLASVLAHRADAHPARLRTASKQHSSAHQYVISAICAGRRLSCPCGSRTCYIPNQSSAAFVESTQRRNADKSDVR
jgi:hypothetical protein